MMLRLVRDGGNAPTWRCAASRSADIRFFMDASVIALRINLDYGRAPGGTQRGHPAGGAGPASGKQLDRRRFILTSGDFPVLSRACRKPSLAIINPGIRQLPAEETIRRIASIRYHAGMRWIYLSPHFDDAVLSCGGLIAGQAAQGEAVEVWTPFAAFPPSGKPLTGFAREKHRDWHATRRTVISVRRAEDQAACNLLRAGIRWGRLPDCIYRRLPNGNPLISFADDLWQPIHPGELPLIQRLRGWMRQQLRPEDRLVCPLTLGNHVDHRLVRAAAESLRRPLYYYADFPYIAREGVQIPDGLPPDQLHLQEISAGHFLEWRSAVACYQSQIADLFGEADRMPDQLEEYWSRGGGSLLWLVK